MDRELRIKQTLCNKRKHVWVYNMYSTYNVHFSRALCYIYFSFVHRCMVCISLFVHMFANVCSCYSISHFGSICSFPYAYICSNTLIRSFLKSYNVPVHCPMCWCSHKELFLSAVLLYSVQYVSVLSSTVFSSLGRYVFGSEISYNKPPPRLPGLGC